MQQRRPRLGDVIDDYCPRERRITNHAVVAMIEDTVKQTRCSTCDAEHEYKQGKAPAARRRKTGAPAAAQLVEGAAGRPRPPTSPRRSRRSTMLRSEIDRRRRAGRATPRRSRRQQSRRRSRRPETENEVERTDEERESENWPVHRPLIRAHAAASRRTSARAQGARLHDPPGREVRSQSQRPPSRRRRSLSSGWTPGSGHVSVRAGLVPIRRAARSRPGSGWRAAGQRHGGGNRPPGQGGGGNRPGQGQVPVAGHGPVAAADGSGTLELVLGP